jgi:UDP-glucose 4-epimerase
MLCHDYQRLYGQAFTILRYGIPYGPRMRKALVIPRFIDKALSGEPLTIAGDGGQYRNFIYVEDLARAHVLALSPRAENQVYNIEGTQRVTILEIAEALGRLLPNGVRIEFVPARAGDYEGKTVSAKKAFDDLGWSPEVDFQEGLLRTVRWYQDTVWQEATAQVT